MKIEFKQTRDIYEYGKIVSSLLPDFGIIFCQTIMEWCKVIPLITCNRNYWEWYLVYYNDKVIGCCGLYSLSDSTDELWLSWFGLLPEYRGNKIGDKMLDFLYSLARTVNCKIVRSYVDKSGGPLKFYKRNGFIITGTVREFLDKNKLKEIDGNEFEDMNDFVIEKNI